MSDRLQLLLTITSWAPTPSPPPTNTHAPPPPGRTFDHEDRPFPIYFPFFIFWHVPVKNQWHCVYLWCGFRLLCVMSVEMQLCENWTKVKQESDLSQADHPLLVAPLLIEIRVSLFWNTDEQYSGCNFLQNADFNRISNNNGPISIGWFPCGLMCGGVWCHCSGCQSAL